MKRLGPQRAPAHLQRADTTLTSVCSRGIPLLPSGHGIPSWFSVIAEPRMLLDIADDPAHTPPHPRQADRKSMVRVKDLPDQCVHLVRP